MGRRFAHENGGCSAASGRWPAGSWLSVFVLPLFYAQSRRVPPLSAAPAPIVTCCYF
ncbi:hypothetical protein G5S37_20200 [Roseimicrobium sp. ORNL1]|nr:hypothetical protein G5S37_20200 [Roseimicrobium sp. ORNL1]